MSLLSERRQDPRFSAGTPPRPGARRLLPRERRYPGSAGGPAAGFTLVEILVALAIVALVVGLTMPKLTELSGVELRTAARRLAGTARYAADQAAVRKTPFRLQFDFAARAYRVEFLDGDTWRPDPTTLGAPVRLPGQVRVALVETRRAGRQREDLASVEFYPKGYAERAVVQLAVGDTRAYTIEVRAYDMRPHIHEGALELGALDARATVPAAR